MKGHIIPTLSNPAPKGWRSRSYVPGVHRGIDYGYMNANPEVTKLVVAAADGVVESIVSDGSYNKGWGNRIVVDHGHGVKTTYNHLRTGTIPVRVGQHVTAGHRLGTMGKTGDSRGDHLHFELLIDGTRVDPAPYFTRPLPGVPSPAPASLTLGAGQRRAIARANRRAEPTTASADLGNDLTPGTVGNFVGFIRGQDVGGNNIWLKGIRGHYFHSGSFAGGADTAGLADLGTWGSPAPAPAAAPKRAHVRIGEPWYVYTSEHAAYHNIVSERRGTVPAGTYLITDYGNDGKPVQIDAPGASGVRNAGRYWIGGRYTAAPVVSQ